MTPAASPLVHLTALALAEDATATGVCTLPAGAVIHAGDGPSRTASRLRLYVSPEARNADRDRSPDSRPARDAGVILDLVLTEHQDFRYRLDPCPRIATDAPVFWALTNYEPGNPRDVEFRLAFIVPPALEPVA